MKAVIANGIDRGKGLKLFEDDGQSRC